MVWNIVRKAGFLVLIFTMILPVFLQISQYLYPEGVLSAHATILSSFISNIGGYFQSVRGIINYFFYSSGLPGLGVTFNVLIWVSLIFPFFNSTSRLVYYGIKLLFGY